MLAQHLFGKISRAGRLTGREPSWGGGGRLPRRKLLSAAIALWWPLTDADDDRRRTTSSDLLKKVAIRVNPAGSNLPRGDALHLSSDQSPGLGNSMVNILRRGQPPRRVPAQRLKISELLIAAWRPGHRYPSAERVQKPRRESPFEVSGSRASPMAGGVYSKSVIFGFTEEVFW